MSTTTRHQAYAIACMRWAAEAKTEEERGVFLAMAQQWSEAALRLDGVATLGTTSPPVPMTHH